MSQYIRTRRNGLRGLGQIAGPTSILGSVKTTTGGTLAGPGTILGGVKTAPAPAPSTGSRLSDAFSTGMSTLTSYFGAKQAEAQAAASMMAQPQQTSYLPWLLLGGAAIATVFILKRRKSG